MSSPSYQDLSELSKDALVDMVVRMQHNELPQNENILARRNRLLTEENENFRKQIDELNSFRMQYYNLDANIMELKQENISLNNQLTQIKQFETNYNEIENRMNKLKLENESLYKQLEHYTMTENQYNDQQNKLQQLHFELNELKAENKNLQDDLLREERLHSNKYQDILNELNQYKTKHHDLLQRYSSMESFVEEFCEDANEYDNNQQIVVIEELTKWTKLLQTKQNNINNVISSKIQYELNDINNELNINRNKMRFCKQEISKNIANSILNDMICSVVTNSNNNMISHSFEQINEEKVRLNGWQNKIDGNKRMMSSQITQLNGQKQIISNLNKTIQDLCDKVKEYEHHIQRLTFQLKQLGLINKASIECNTDFNIQQIQILSKQLMEKQIEFDQLQKKIQSKDKLIDRLNIKINEFNDIYSKYDGLKREYESFNIYTSELQKKNESLSKELMIKKKENEAIEINYNSLRNEMQKIMNECNKLKQNEYNYKLTEQALKEKYQINYDKFNKEYSCLSSKIEILENRNNCLQNEAEKYHSAMIKNKEQYKGLMYKYEKLQNNQKILKNQYDATKPKLLKYENKIKELIMIINNNNNMNKQNMQNMNNNNNESLEIQQLKQEIDRLNEQLFEGSNIRNELRAFIAKYQREGQMKLNKSYTKLTFMKKLVFSTFRVLNENREYIDNNNALRQHLDYLRQKLQDNQENIQPKMTQ